MSYIRGAAGDEHDSQPLLDIKAVWGYIPNFFRAQTLRPDLIRAEVQLIEGLLVNESALTRRQKEYVFLVCAADNLSTYCVTAHCEIVRMLGIEGPEPEQIALDHSAADIPAADKALLDFAVKLNNRQKDVGGQDIELLRQNGFQDAHILEAVLMVGLAKFANFVSIGLGVLPEFDSSRVVRELGLDPVPSAAPAKAENILNPEAGDAPLISDEDSDLVRQVRNGEIEAFDELVRRHQRQVYRTLIAITHSPDDAEDGLQNVFLKAFQNIASFHGASRFRTWLTRIAINEGMERLRSRPYTRPDTRALDEFESDSETPFRPRDISPWQANPEQLYSQKELREKVETELLRLPAKYRLPVMLRDLQQFSAEEAAEILKIGVPALKSRLLRGRLMLREAMVPVLGRRAANV